VFRYLFECKECSGRRVRFSERSDDPDMLSATLCPGHYDLGKGPTAVTPVSMLEVLNEIMTRLDRPWSDDGPTYRG
jgi:hypothetical protein